MFRSDIDLGKSFWGIKYWVFLTSFKIYALNLLSELEDKDEDDKSDEVS